jgi:hypothetical protein
VLQRGSRRTGRAGLSGTEVVTCGWSRLASSPSLARAMAGEVRVTIGAVYRRGPGSPQTGHGLALRAVPIGSWTSQGPHRPHWYM